MSEIKKSSKLDHVLNDIRGPVMDEAKRMEEEGYHILKLNIGNPAPFGLNAPDEIIQDVISNVRNAQGVWKQDINSSSSGNAELSIF